MHVYIVLTLSISAPAFDMIIFMIFIFFLFWQSIIGASLEVLAVI